MGAGYAEPEVSTRMRSGANLLVNSVSASPSLPTIVQHKQPATRRRKKEMNEWRFNPCKQAEHHSKFRAQSSHCALWQAASRPLCFRIRSSAMRLCMQCHATRPNFGSNSRSEQTRKKERKEERKKERKRE